MKKIFVITGEASGDLHGCNLVQSLQSKNLELEIHGVGGNRMEALGLASFINMAHIHATGITEVLCKLPHFIRFFYQVLNKVKEVKPDLVVFIDNPGFNLRLAKKLKPLGFSMVYYICPQIWAWAGHRIHLIKACFKKMLVVFEFEKAFYEKHAVPVSWVGHPMRDEMQLEPTEHINNDDEKLNVLLMPGSRTNEIRTLFDAMLGAVKLINQEFPRVRFSLLKADTFPKEYFKDSFNGTLPIDIVGEDRYETMRKADLAIVCSGTATLELGLLNIPMVILYRASLLTALIAKAVLTVHYFGLPNLLADKGIVPELIQYDCTPEKIFDRVSNLIRFPDYRLGMRKKLADAVRGVGERGTSNRAAEEILNLIPNFRHKA